MNIAPDITVVTREDKAAGSMAVDLSTTPTVAYARGHKLGSMLGRFARSTKDHSSDAVANTADYAKGVVQGVKAGYQGGAG